MDEDGTPYGMWGDHCPYCGHDWKAPHDEECPRFVRCGYPPGCTKAAAPGRLVCREHYEVLAALFAPAKRSVSS